MKWLVGVSIAVLVLACGLADSAFAARWRVERVAVPVADSGLAGVSCRSSTECMAVGDFVTSGGHYTGLVERWNNASWSLATVPGPRGSAASHLLGVSCWSSSGCIAVGFRQTGSGTVVTWAERWDGTSWTLQSTPSPSKSDSEFTEVSCALSASCIAVGSTWTASGSAPLAERWDGSSWTVEPTVGLGGSSGSHLEGLSCPSATACVAVGWGWDSSGHEVPLAERWDGSSWTIERPPSASGASYSRLYGVSCSSGTACTAVGYSLASSGNVTLAERWDGSSWTIQSTPNVPAGANRLYGVSCPSTVDCVAVGYSPAGMLAERWDGTAWTIGTTPAPTDAYSELSGVSCASSTACTAVGGLVDSASGTHMTLAERWDGVSWTTQTSPNPLASDMSFDGVSCRSAVACTAVGYYSRSGTRVSLAERWDGTSWTIQSTSNFRGASSNSLDGVSCPTLSDCTAVGSYHLGGADYPLAERWNGTAWWIRSTPNPAGAAHSNLVGVSCSSGTVCTAVGSWANAAGHQLTLAERRDGASWSIEPTPNPSGATDSYLSSVSCTSASHCTAVGWSSLGTLVEQWDGTSWTIAASPSPTAGSELRDVSCTSSILCTAVGREYSGSMGDETLAERWDGTSWTIQNTPPCAHSLLSGVSCASSITCTAVGITDTLGASPLAEKWDGTSSTIQTTPALPNASNSSLVDVSCASKTICLAVGFLTPETSGSGHLLAERFS